jgi:hypothetical protein
MGVVANSRHNLNRLLNKPVLAAVCYLLYSKELFDGCNAKLIFTEAV